MSIPVNPVFPVIGAQAAAPDLVLQPGTVINARVVKILDDNLVRIAIASLSINVLSEVDLQPGAILKFAVSQTPEGIRLAIIPPVDGSVDAGVAPTPVGPAISASASQVTDVSAIVNRAAVNPVPPILSPVEALAVTAATQAAAARQTGLSQLFANASVAAVSENLPEPLQQASQQLLAVRPDLTTNLSGDDIRSAFQKSGLFLEASLASGLLPSPSDTPDLKAALIVFRETLSAWLDTAAPETSTVPTSEQGPSPTVQTQATHAGTAADPDALALPAPEIEVEEVYLPKALLPLAEDLSSGILSSITPPLTAAARAATVTAALNILQNIARPASSGVVDAVKTLDGEFVVGAGIETASEQGLKPTDLPPPPFRGADPTPQPVSAPSIVPDAAPIEIVRHLVEDADGAIARQTLMQIASLPDRVDGPGVRADPATARWNFEIPFATPKGTAVAQFEISRDGSGGQAVAGKGRVWRARFSLNVEPAGPVHALVSLIGETTSVRMWAERPETANKLRDNTTQLGHALRQAELEPGDIVVGGGAPAQSVAPAGHFLDRAT
jgi:hypothetical protein